MKLLFSIVFILSSLAYAKNKILYKTCVNCTKDSKEEPLYDLTLQADFKIPGSVTLESRGRIEQYGSGEDFIAYIKKEDKEYNLYIVTDFRSLVKRKISDRVNKFVIRSGVLFFEKSEPSGDKYINVLYAISDFKTALKSEVRRGYGEFSVDDY